MDANLLFEHNCSVSSISALSVKYQTQNSPQRVSFGPEWGKGDGLVFQPCAGFHFGTCGPLKVKHEIQSECTYERPVVVCMLMLSGRTHLYFSGKSERKIDLVSGMFMLGCLSDVSSSITTPAQDDYSHIAMVIEIEALTSIFGDASYNHLQELIHGGDFDVDSPAMHCGLADLDCMCSVDNMLRFEVNTPGIFFRHAMLNVFMALLHCADKRSATKNVSLMEDDVAILIEVKKDIDKNYLFIETARYFSKYGMNRSKLSQGFKQLFGTTISRYVRSCKMKHAHQMLVDRRMNVSQCAFEVGYSNIGHFIGAYKRLFGVTPKQTMRLGA